MVKTDMERMILDQETRGQVNTTSYRSSIGFKTREKCSHDNLTSDNKNNHAEINVLGEKYLTVLLFIHSCIFQTVKSLFT